MCVSDLFKSVKDAELFLKLTIGKVQRRDDHIVTP